MRFILHTNGSSQEIVIDRSRTTFGRGSEADERFEDEGLSRLHASVYREGDRVWIVDENSANGTFVNGAQVSGSGTPLQNGDSIKIGNNTVFSVQISEIHHSTAASAPKASAARTANVASTGSGSPIFGILPMLLIGFALMIFSVSGILIAYKVLGNGKTEVAANYDDEDPIDKEPTTKTTPTPSKKTESNSGSVNTSNSGKDEIDIPADNTSSTPAYQPPSGKKYLDMSETERRQYLSDRAMRIAQIIGNRSTEQIPAAALDKIKSFTDAYAKRINVKPLGGCRFGDNLEVTYKRASENAPFIVRAFNEKGIDPRIGLYLAMIESEHCVCLQSPTGPLGMFQFTKSTGENHGLKTKPGASPSNPDERCEPEPSARAAASYMKSLTGRYGTGPASVPLAIGSYNSGEGGLSSNLTKALESNSGLPRDFWTLISKGDILSTQFQSENFKYVPKFFAAAIVGEYPADFGMKLQPISSYSR